MTTQRGLTLAAYGDWIASLAPWTHFITLTHDPRRLASADSRHTRVGVQRHHRLRKLWVMRTVRSLDPSSKWWSETELHLTGQPHEHGLLYAAENAPVYSMLDRWEDMAGAWRCERIDDVGDVASYVAKYGQKSASWEMMTAGFALLPRPSFATTFGAAIR